jgi:hypothetical protein
MIWPTGEGFYSGRKIRDGTHEYREKSIDVLSLVFSLSYLRLCSRQLYGMPSALAVTRSVSEGPNLFPRLRFGLRRIVP